MANEGYHEPIEELTDETRDMHKAIVSLMEELEAIDWYNQRVDSCKDEELKAILAHNRDEEKEHAAMVLEWIRRRNSDFAERLKTYLFTDAPITGIEKAVEQGGGEGGGGEAPGTRTTVGSLKGRR